MNTEITKQSEAAQVAQVLPPEPDKRALNAVSHGLTAEHIPPDEREGYAQHVEHVRASTGASNYLEQRLADRAALALWRLDRVARYEQAQAGNMRRAASRQIKEGATHGPAQYVTAAYKTLGELLGITPQTLREEPQHVEARARMYETEAAYLLKVADAGSAAGCSEDEAYTLGWALVELLTQVKVPAADMVRAMTGRPAKRGEGQTLADSEWEFEPEEMPGLLGLYRERLGDRAGDILRGYAVREQLRARKLRAALSEAQAAERDALALAALPAVEVLDKVTRYEAHLERVLYRALHDLEAARLGREGKASGAPLRGVLDERPSE